VGAASFPEALGLRAGAGEGLWCLLHGGWMLGRRRLESDGSGWGRDGSRRGG
jgi:hypothetical protein